MCYLIVSICHYWDFSASFVVESINRHSRKIDHVENTNAPASKVPREATS